MVSRYASLPSPKLPLFPKQQSFAAFVAYTSESSPARPAALPVTTAPLLHRFIAFSAAEPVEIYREKALFDCLGTFNLSISVACAVLPAMGTELVRSNILPASFIVPEDEEPLPPVEIEPFDWLLVLQTSSLTLARDLLGKIVQQCVEIFSKARVPKCGHAPLAYLWLNHPHGYITRPLPSIPRQRRRRAPCHPVARWPTCGSTGATSCRPLRPRCAASAPSPLPSPPLDYSSSGGFTTS